MSQVLSWICDVVGCFNVNEKLNIESQENQILVINTIKLRKSFFFALRNSLVIVKQHHNICANFYIVSSLQCPFLFYSRFRNQHNFHIFLHVHIKLVIDIKRVNLAINCKYQNNSKSKLNSPNPNQIVQITQKLTILKHRIQQVDPLIKKRAYIVYSLVKIVKDLGNKVLNVKYHKSNIQMQNSFSKIPKIRVVIRKRPLNKKQLGRGQQDIIQIPNSQTVLVKEQKVKVDLTPYTDEYKFIFDDTFNEQATNQQIYIKTVRPLIDAAFDGARVSCFAYGQTGSGKTHTMLGNGSNVKGLYLLATKDVFQLKNNYEDISIYCGKLYDLLNQRNILHARQDAKNNINIVGLSQRNAQSMNQVMNTIQFGSSIRVTSQNSTNMDSSRSHAILQINLKRRKKLHGKISFIDLAGSERAADHADQTDKQTRIDGAEINKSLLALKECIRALDQNKQHTPFRGSKLTMVLKDSFTGYCKTVMIGNVSPNSSSCQNTLNTLKYADRVKQLKKPNQNEIVEGDYLNDLSRELMLPRQLVYHQQINQNQQRGQSQNTPGMNNYFEEQVQIDSDFKRRRILTVQTNKSNLYKKQLDFGHKKQKQTGKSNNKQKTHSNTKLASNSKSNYNHNNSIDQLSSLADYKYKNNSNSNSKSQQQTYAHLSERHQQMVQNVIHGQQKLLCLHQKYINFSVDAAKEHIQMMNQADDVGSTIQNYLNKLDSKLETELEQIQRLKAQIQNLKYNLEESSKVEKLYLSVDLLCDKNQQHKHQKSTNFSNPTHFNYQYNHRQMEFNNNKSGIQINCDIGQDEQLLFQ